MPREARERQTILTKDGYYVTKTLPEICMDVHMYNTGAGPDLGSAQYEEYKKILQIAVDNWKEERPCDKLFDDAILNLIKTTLKEGKGDMNELVLAINTRTFSHTAEIAAIMNKVTLIYQGVFRMEQSLVDFLDHLTKGNRETK